MIVESTALSETQAQDAARDPANIVIPAMPISLIEPCMAADYGIAGGSDQVAEAVAAKQARGIAEVGADKSTATGADVRVAVLDTGITWAHPAFAGLTPVPRNWLFTPPRTPASRWVRSTLPRRRCCSGEIIKKASVAGSCAVCSSSEEPHNAASTRS
jgi:hypothetical protein